MRHLVAVVTAVLALSLTASVSTLGVATADAAPGPPYVEHAVWAHWGDLSSLRVYPTSAGREAAGQLGTLAQGDEAWREVLTLSPDAEIPGMREQFMCHWRFAEFVEPGKTSWNLEPWRPVVDDAAMADAHCNPGGTEEPF